MWTERNASGFARWLRLAQRRHRLTGAERKGSKYYYMRIITSAGWWSRTAAVSNLYINDTISIRAMDCTDVREWSHKISLKYQVGRCVFVKIWRNKLPMRVTALFLFRESYLSFFICIGICCCCCCLFVFIFEKGKKQKIHDDTVQAIMLRTAAGWR